MTPLEQAIEVYSQEQCARPFDEDLNAYLLGGIVYSSPELFLMGRAVPRVADPAHIVNPYVAFPEDQCDCWHIALLAGTVSDAFALPLCPKPYISFEKRNRIRFYPFWILDLCMNKPTSFTAGSIEESFAVTGA